MYGIMPFCLDCQSTVVFLCVWLRVESPKTFVLKNTVGQRENLVVSLIQPHQQNFDLLFKCERTSAAGLYFQACYLTFIDSGSLRYISGIFARLILWTWQHAPSILPCFGPANCVSYIHFFSSCDWTSKRHQFLLFLIFAVPFGNPECNTSLIAARHISGGRAFWFLSREYETCMNLTCVYCTTG